MPSLVAIFKAVSSNGNLSFIVKNLGRGAALNIDVNFYLKEESGMSDQSNIGFIEPR
jgi:hypothetical protein